MQNQTLPCQIFKEPLNPRINEQLLKTSGADVLFYPALGKIPEKLNGEWQFSAKHCPSLKQRLKLCK